MHPYLSCCLDYIVVDPIKKRKQELEDERLPEFAPPVSYYKSNRQKSLLESDYFSNDSNTVNNSADVSASSQSSNFQPPFQLPPLFAYPFPPSIVTNSLSENEQSSVPDKNTIRNTTTPQNTEDSNDSNIRESVSEVLRYYKTKSVITE